MITSAVTKDNTVRVYDKTHLLFSKAGKLHGYTNSAVSVNKDNTIYTYDEKNKLISSVPTK